MIKAVLTFDDKSVMVNSENVSNIGTKFRPGIYNCSLDNSGNITIVTTEFGELHDPIPSTSTRNAISAVSKFVSNESRVSCGEMGFNYKLNILFYGRPGTGKTSLMNFISNELMINHKAIVFNINSVDSLKASWVLGKMIREIQDNIIIFIVDEFDRYSYKLEAELKTMLDGNESIDNSIVLASTNYLDNIPDSFIKRPSRFRVVNEIKGISDQKIVRGIVERLHAKVTNPFLSDKDIDDIVDNSVKQELTIDEIKMFIIDKLMNMTVFDEKVKTIGYKTTEEDQDYDDDDDGFDSIFSSGLSYSDLLTIFKR